MPFHWANQPYREFLIVLFPLILVMPCYLPPPAPHTHLFLCFLYLFLYWHVCVCSLHSLFSVISVVANWLYWTPLSPLFNPSISVAASFADITWQQPDSAAPCVISHQPLGFQWAALDQWKMEVDDKYTLSSGGNSKASSVWLVRKAFCHWAPVAHNSEPFENTPSDWVCLLPWTSCAASWDHFPK